MNVLLTSVGRRAYLVKYFKDVLGDNGKVFVCNSDDKTVAFHYADEYIITPIVYDENYVPFLLDYCKKNKIDILLSLFDIDLKILAKNKENFESIGTKVIVSDEKFISICNDKWETYKYLKNRGFNVPKTYLTLQKTLVALETGDLYYPVIVKPRFGCGSIALSVAEDELGLLYHYTRNVRTINKSYLKYESDFVGDKIVFQEFLDGQEYGVDIINDLSGVFQTAIIKKKIAMRAGETDIAQTIENNLIYEQMEKLGKHTGHIGNIDCDVFLVDDKPFILEMNARFGGGYPFSHMAGCNLPQAIVNWCSGIDVDTNLLKAKPNIMGFKELIITVS